MSIIRALTQEAMLPEGLEIRMNQVERATLGAVVAAKDAITTFQGPYSYTKKSLNRPLWEKDRRKRKASRKARKRNR